MATATYLKGDLLTVQYACPTTAGVAVDTILVVGTNDNRSLGVARDAITAGTTGIVDIAGCYIMPKVTGAAIKAGESVDWDSSAAKVEDNQSTCTTGDIANFGVALADAAAGTSTVKVKLEPNKDVT